MEHNISVRDMAAVLGTTPEKLRDIENKEGNVPEEWLQHIYDHFDLSPEERFILGYYVDTQNDDKTVMTHTYKNHTVIVRGRHSLSIRDAEGKEVLHTCSRAKEKMTVKDMEQVIDSYLLLIDLMDEDEN